LFEKINGVEYVSHIRRKNIFVIIDYKAYKGVEHDKRLEELNGKPDSKEKTKSIKKLKSENEQIPNEEPPLLLYPKNFPLDEDALKCLSIAKSKLKS